jgi:hypothetical protein
MKGDTLYGVDLAGDIAFQEMGMHARFVLAIGMSALVLGAAPSAALGDPLQERLDKAVADYNEAVDKETASLAAHIDAKIAAAQAKGDLDLKKSFEAAKDSLQKGTRPSLQLLKGVVESASRDITRARNRLLIEYKDVEREYVKQGKDVQAEAIRVESQKLEKAVWIERANDPVGAGSRPARTDVYLADLQEQRVSVGKEGVFAKAGDYAVNRVPVKKPIFLHPPSNGSSEVTYDIPSGYKMFKAVAAICDSGSVNQPTPLVFRVVGGTGNVLWTSKPLRGPGASEACEILVGQEKTLKLVVDCNGWYAHAQAIWCDPRFCERR